MARAHHLHDERLLDCYLAERGGEARRSAGWPSTSPTARRAAPATPSSTQLHGRPPRQAPRPRADAVFTPERLRAQQQQIAAAPRARRARRARHQLPRRARPAAASRRARRASPRAGSPPPPPPGCSSASAAGLFFDFDARRSARSRSSPAPGPAPSAPRPTRLAGSTAPAAPSSEAADEAFLLGARDWRSTGPRRAS